MIETKDLITLVSLKGVPLRTLSRETDWVLEELSGSTNRLEVTIPLEEGIGVTTEQELLFRKKRYVIVEMTRHKNSRTIQVIADEAQVELNNNNIRVFRLSEDTLEGAIKKALSGSNWTVKDYMGTEHTFSADIEDISSMHCLTFLANQISGVLRFDSINRQVSILAPDDLEASQVFKYGINMDDISKTEIQPSITIIYPYGKDGMSIASMNEGKEYIEDFTWYTGLGISLSEARARYSKEMVWKDERYIYTGNLLRDAQKKLATLSHPQINYKIKASGIDAEKLSVHEPVYVADEELGIKLRTAVSRKILHKDRANDVIELDYIPDSLNEAFSDDGLGDSSLSSNSEAVFVLKNRSQLNIGAIPEPVLQTSINVITSTFFTAGLTMVLNVATAGTLDAYFMMDGEMLPTKIRQTLNAGWNTIGIPFLVTQVQEGTKAFDLYMSMSSGSATIAIDELELYITSKGALGGASNKRPDRRVSDEIIIPTVRVSVDDSVKLSIAPPKKFPLKDIITIPAIRMAMVEKTSVTLEGNITPPDSIPKEELVPVTRDGFGDMSKYEGMNTPTQEAVNTFIDVTYKDNMMFKSISVLGQMYIFSTMSQSIGVDYIYRTITSFEPMQILTPTDEVLTDVGLLDWSAEMGIIVEHGLMFRKLEHPYQYLLNNIPVPYKKQFDGWLLTEYASGEIRLYYVNGKTYKYMNTPDRFYMFGTNSGAVSYIWNGERWVYRSETTSTWFSSTDFTVLYSSKDIYADDTNVIYRPADIIGDVSYEPLVNALTYNIPVPPDREYDGFAIGETPSEHRLYFINGQFKHNLTTDGFDIGTEPYAYSYLWDGKAWVFRSNTSGATGWFSNSYIPMLYSSLPLLNSETGEVLREADDMSLVTFKHLNELPTPPDVWLDNPYYISTWGSGDYLRLYYYTGELVYGHDSDLGYLWSTTESGWYSYKWDGKAWVYRSENPNGANREATHLLTVDNVQYNSHDFTDLEGNVVIPAGYNVIPYT